MKVTKFLVVALVSGLSISCVVGCSSQQSAPRCSGPAARNAIDADIASRSDLAGGARHPDIVAIDWYSQLRRCIGRDATGRELFTPAPRDLVSVQGKIEAGSAFSRMEDVRYVNIGLLPGNRVPGHPRVQRIELRVDLTRWWGGFFDRPSPCTLRFVPDGQLFDILGGDGADAPAPRSAIVLDWASQLRRNVSDTTDEVYPPDPPGLIPVPVHATQKYALGFLQDVPGLGGQRRVMLQVTGGAGVPFRPDVGTIELILDFTGSTNAFFRVGSDYTVRFTRAGELYDVVDQKGRSGGSPSWVKPPSG